MTPPRTLTAFRRPLVALVEDVLHQGVESGSDLTARKLLDRLTAPDVTNQLSEAVQDALASAAAAYALRDDLYENPFDSRVGAEIAITAILQELRREVDPEPRTPPYEVLAARVAELAYKPGWDFTLVLLPGDQPAVKVVAQVEDSRGAKPSFVTGRVVPIVDGDVTAAAFRGVMQIEEHEARERFTLGASRPFDPHGAAVPAATNTRN